MSDSTKPAKSAEKSIKPKVAKKDDSSPSASPDDAPAPTQKKSVKLDKAATAKSDKSDAPAPKEARELKVDQADADDEKLITRVGNCRFYEQKYPEVDDVVVVEVKRIEQMGAYVALKEYKDIEGMILLSELSRRRIRSINKLIRVGRLEVVVVLRVDKEKGYIDLSKRRVTDEDVLKAEEKFNKAKAVHSILSHVADVTHRDLESLYTQIGWPMYKKYGHALEGFRTAMSEKGIFKDFGVDDATLAPLMKSIEHKLKAQPMKIRADIDVTCFGYEGIDAIKRALKKGEESSKQDGKEGVKIKLVAPPLYVIVTTAMNKQQGVDAIMKAIDVIKEEIVKAKGDLQIQVQPRAVLERDEKELQKKLKMVAQEQKEGEQSDDEDDDGEDDEEDEEDESEDEEDEPPKKEEKKPALSKIKGIKKQVPKAPVSDDEEEK